MLFDWNDYSSDDGTESVPLLLSTKSQSIILAAMETLENRFSWLEVDDATWDEIHAAVGEAYEEIIEVQTVADGIPVGLIMAWSGEIADIPEKWLICDGDTFLGADYPELFAVIGETFKTETHFSVPNTRDRFMLGSGINDDLGDLGGNNYLQLTQANLPAHVHVVPAHAHTIPARANAGTTAGVAGLASAAANTTIATDTEAATNTSSIGDNEAFNNMPEYIAVHWIIKAIP